MRRQNSRLLDSQISSCQRTHGASCVAILQSTQLGVSWEALSSQTFQHNLLTHMLPQHSLLSFLVKAAECAEHLAGMISTGL
jgi:hypothetical protein